MGGEYKIIPDPEYGYLRADPVPTAEEVARYYQEEFYSSKYKQFNDSSLAAQQAEQEFNNARWDAMVRACAEHFGKAEGLSVFDIGFGFAQALLYFRSRGMRVSGLEPSPEGVAYARAQGLEVFQSGIEELPELGERRCDVVTLFNVLEHLRCPADTLRQIRRNLLRERGLLVLDVPNEFNDFQVVADREYGLKQWWVVPPNHINYFSVSSLKSLLDRCGYDVIRCESSFPLELFMLLGDVYVGNGELGKACHGKRVLFERLMARHGKQEKLRRFYEALAGLDLGRQVVVYAVPR